MIHGQRNVKLEPEFTITELSPSLYNLRKKYRTVT